MSRRRGSRMLKLGLLITFCVAMGYIVALTNDPGGYVDKMPKEAPRGDTQQKQQTTNPQPPGDSTVADPAKAIVGDRKETESKPKKDGPLYELYETAEFEADKPRQVVILANQRVGSSFFGEIFDRNPDIFYVYEPLDALYQAMYGSEAGWTIPSDITTFQNGTRRLVPKGEIDGVSEFVSNLMSCDVEKLPPEFFLHKFWDFLAVFMPSWKPYHKCLVSHDLVKAIPYCAKQSGIDHTCPHRFGENMPRSEFCRNYLSPENGYVIQKSADDKNIEMFLEYKKCLVDKMKKGNKCVDIMRRKCNSTQLHATKTVRATMDSMESLLKNNPNMRVVHLIRDPRAVVTSRMSAKGYKGLYTTAAKQISVGRIREAGIYCDGLYRDIRKRRQLEQLYPGRIIQVVYEDFFMHPAEYAKAVYTFLGYDIPTKLLPWVKEQTGSVVGSHRKVNATMPKWRKIMQAEEVHKINAQCIKIPDLAGFHWDEFLGKKNNTSSL